MTQPDANLQKAIDMLRPLIEAAADDEIPESMGPDLQAFVEHCAAHGIAFIIDAERTSIGYLPTVMFMPYFPRRDDRDGWSSVLR